MYNAKLTMEICEGEAPPECRALRREVFVAEQQVSEREEFDGLDAQCIHFLARGENGAPVGCARLRPLGGARAKVERVAVAAALRKRGLGAALMAALEAEARRRGWPQLELHAQLRALDFYARLGWRAQGAVFTEAEIPHRKMVKSI